jgi:hypothetical protein
VAVTGHWSFVVRRWSESGQKVVILNLSFGFCLVLGAWNLEFAWNLVLGAWNLEFSLDCLQISPGGI